MDMDVEIRKKYIKNKAINRVMKKIEKGGLSYETNYNFNRMYGFR